MESTTNVIALPTAAALPVVNPKRGRTGRNIIPSSKLASRRWHKAQAQVNADDVENLARLERARDWIESQIAGERAKMGMVQ